MDYVMNPQRPKYTSPGLQFPSAQTQMNGLTGVDQSRANQPINMLPGDQASIPGPWPFIPGPGDQVPIPGPSQGRARRPRPRPDRPYRPATTPTVTGMSTAFNPGMVDPSKVAPGGREYARPEVAPPPGRIEYY